MQVNMPRARTSTFRIPSASMLSLSHSITVRVLHRRVLDRHQLVEPPGGDDEAADMLREMPGEADDLADQLHCLRELPVGGIEADLAQALGGDRLRCPSPRSDLRARR